MLRGEIAAGQLLVATEPGKAGYFDRSVVLILDHSGEGTIGVCLGQPTTVTLDDALPNFAPYATPAVLFDGGPVNEETAIVLGLPADIEDPPLGWQPIADHIGLVDTTYPAELVASSFAQIRVFVGLAGWAPGQLEAELIRGAWFRTGYRVSDVFGPPEELWSKVLRRMGGVAGRWSTWTASPELN